MTNRTATWVSLGGAAAMALGSFLPWAAVRSGVFHASVTGVEGGDGNVTLVAAAVIGVLALVELERARSGTVPWVPSRLIRMLIVGAALVGGGIAYLDAQNILGSPAASVGLGLILVGAGAIAAFVGAASMSGRAAPVDPTSPTVTPADALIKLSALRQSGVLTDEEYEAQKRRLLEP